VINASLQLLSSNAGLTLGRLSAKVLIFANTRSLLTENGSQGTVVRGSFFLFAFRFSRSFGLCHMLFFTTLNGCAELSLMSSYD